MDDPFNEDDISLSMRQTSATALLITALVLGLAVPSLAQTATPSFDDLRSASHQGESVYLTDRTGATTKGRVVRISATSIALLVNDQAREWPASDVTWITQRRSRAGRGALAGLIAGAAFAPLLVAADGSCRQHYDGCGRDDAAAAFYLAPFFGGFGAAIGAAIGLASRPERILYSAAKQSTTLRLAPSMGPRVIGLRAQVGF